VQTTALEEVKTSKSALAAAVHDSELKVSTQTKLAELFKRLADEERAKSAELAAAVKKLTDAAADNEKVFERERQQHAKELAAVREEVERAKQTIAQVTTEKNKLESEIDAARERTRLLSLPPPGTARVAHAPTALHVCDSI
jgi:hypothetical protein